MSITIAIIEDNKNYRESLVNAFSAFEDCLVVHKMNNALNIEKYFNEAIPDIALIDINMPGLDGIEAVKEITNKYPGVQCIMLTANVDLDMVLKCIQNGAKGYLVKDKDSIIKIVDAIKSLHNDNYDEEFPLNSRLAKKMLTHFIQIEKTLDEKLSQYSLTVKQKEILLLLYNGKSYKQIAAECNISIDTLNSHVKAIYPKLKIKSRSEIKNRLM